MKPLGIRIVNAAEGKQIALGNNTQVYAVMRLDDGSTEEVDISNIVRSADVRLTVGEVVTARLDVFVTGVESRAEVESLMVRHFKPRKRTLWRRLRDATTFGARDGVTEYV